MYEETRNTNNHRLHEKENTVADSLSATQMGKVATDNVAPIKTSAKKPKQSKTMTAAKKRLEDALSRISKIDSDIEKHKNEVMRLIDEKKAAEKLVIIAQQGVSALMIETADASEVAQTIQEFAELGTDMAEIMRMLRKRDFSELAKIMQKTDEEN